MDSYDTKIIVTTALSAFIILGFLWFLSDRTQQDNSVLTGRVIGEYVTQYSCKDSDDKNFFSKGSVTILNDDGINTYTDFCRNMDSDVLVEYECVNDNYYKADIQCPYGCANGACVLGRPYYVHG